MRITMQTINNNILSNLNRITDDLNSLNQRISSGKQMSKPSDAPVNLANALGLRTNYAELQQYQTNVSFGDNVINASENTLMELKGLVSRAKVLALQDVNASMTQENRANAAEEIKHLFEQALTLANTQVGGKFIFGGYRTTGYNDIEPTPFMQDLQDGYRVNGYTQDNINTGLTSTMAAGNIAAGDLAVNGNVTTGVINAGALTNGLYMGKADNAKTEIMTADPTVNVALTTLNAGAATTADGGGGSQFFMYLNGVPLTVDISTGATQTQVADETAAAINLITDRTGVSAVRGDGTNGGAVDTVVFMNAQAGDESSIDVTGFSTVSGTAALGFTDFTQAADNTHNTGQITITSPLSVALTSPNNLTDDSILTSLGLGGGAIGFADEAGDGAIVFGSRLATGDLDINGTALIGAISDGFSDVLADISAAAKANAINAGTATNGVRAKVTPVSLTGNGVVTAGTESSFLTGIVTANPIAAGDLAINGIAIGAINGAAAVDGLNMGKAFNAREAINLQTVNHDVIAHLTTLSAGAAAIPGTISNVSFDLNGTAIAFTTSASPASDAIMAINAVTEQTGVQAVVGNGANGGAVGAVVLNNVLTGDESNIIITGYAAGAGTASVGLGNVNQVADATHNTGQISYSTSGTAGVSLTSPTLAPATDAVLAELGLDGGFTKTGIVGDVAGDGTINYGSTPEILDSGDLSINGINIFDSPTLAMGGDSNNNIINAINAKQGQTGISATRSSNGTLILSATDGRNLHINTSALGEKITHLNGSSPSTPEDKVYFGSVILYSDRQFSMATTPTAVSGYELGLLALGLDGGSAITGEAADVAGDGYLAVKRLINKEGSVRYTGDRDNDLEIRVGSTSTLAVSKNGADALLNTSLFRELKGLEDLLRGANYRQAQSGYQESDTSVTLETRNTGDISEDYFMDGSFSVSVIDNEYTPARQTTTFIGIDASEDTFADVAEKFNGIPGINASWDASGYLQIETIDQDRYSLSMKDETGNFLRLMGLTDDAVQVNNIQQSISAFDVLADSLTSQVSDFGARANRILVQKDIYASLTISVKENLSEMEDTDITKALLDLKAKEMAYEAALSAAAKTMQMSLVNYL